MFSQLISIGLNTWWVTKVNYPNKYPATHYPADFWEALVVHAADELLQLSSTGLEGTLTVFIFISVLQEWEATGARLIQRLFLKNMYEWCR